MADFTPNSRARIGRVIRQAESGAFSRERGNGGRRGDGHTILLARALETVQAGNLCRFRIMECDDSHKGDEQPLSTDYGEEQAFVRRGLCIVDEDYLLIEVCGGDDTLLDVLNPTMSFIGRTDGAISKGNGGDVSVYGDWSASMPGYIDTGATASVRFEAADIASGTLCKCDYLAGIWIGGGVC